MHQKFYDNLEDWIIGNPTLNAEIERTFGMPTYTSYTKVTLKTYYENPLKIICKKIKDELQKAGPQGLGKLDNCGTYHAVDNKGNWHYWNGTSWCSMPNLAEYYKQKGWEQAIEMQYEEGD
jgi:hypothetical protein